MKKEKQSIESEASAARHLFCTHMDEKAIIKTPPPHLATADPTLSRMNRKVAKVPQKP